MTTTTTEIDRLLIQTLREVVRGNEDYVYETPHGAVRTCAYRDPGGEPSCGIGHVADRLDLPVEEGVAARALAGEWGASEVVACALGVFQNAQDRRVPWGAALAQAEAYLVEPRRTWSRWAW